MSATMTFTRHRLTITTEAPLHHGAFGGGDAGNAVLFRRMRLANNPDHPGVPVVSGNALRGLLRRVVMRDLFARVGLDRLSPDLEAKQWDRLYAALANGGHLTGSETKAVPERMRVLREAIPPLSVLGAALYSFMMPGRVSVGFLWPVCHETIAAGLCDGMATTHGESLITEVSLVRHVDRDEQDPANSGVTPMPVTVEALMPGTVLQGTITWTRVPTPVEIGVIGYGLSQVRTLGGKGGGGFGRLRIDHQVDAGPYEAWLAEPANLTRCREVMVALAQDAI